MKCRHQTINYKKGQLKEKHFTSRVSQNYGTWKNKMAAVSFEQVIKFQMGKNIWVLTSKEEKQRFTFANFENEVI